ncbi:archaetidylserine decarboxylase [Rhabdochlamydiaceae symbiont of Dictyostelium giganteum]|uniref:archaetidylserine decarboxylase n=1 Tax=Rhabdochlamydiaceae symbiont of Dictyostelium giganteum TaxID=3342349 RepID=UPI00384E1D12
MPHIYYTDRNTQEKKIEKVYKGFLVRLFYRPHFLLRGVIRLLRPLITHSSLVSKLYGKLQNTKWSRRKITPFIQQYAVNIEEFQDAPHTFKTFNDFFIRKLKKNSRPLHPSSRVAVLPADGKYLVFPKASHSLKFFVKGRPFSISSLIKDPVLAKTYEEGSLLIARLSPPDYHRFHFPCDGTPLQSRPINGPLFSVNPLALQSRPSILAENKRVITPFESVHFGVILYLEIGATNVGTIHQTFSPYTFYHKGDEKGYFSFGGSSLILLFEKNTIQFEADLVEASSQGMEISGRFGEPMGISLR